MIFSVTQYIANNTTFVIGSTLFAGFGGLDIPETAVVVQELVPGLADGLLTDKVQKLVRVLSRAKSYATARANAYSVFDFLHGKMQITLPVVDSGGIYLCNIEGTLPFYIGLDDKFRHQFVTNFIFKSQTM